MPIIAATDVNTDIGRIAEKNGYGYWCESVKVDDFTACVDEFMNKPESIKLMGEKGYQFLCDNYQIQHTYHAIVEHLK